MIWTPVGKITPPEECINSLSPRWSLSSYPLLKSSQIDKMATSGRESGNGHNRIDALGINGSSDERGHGIVAPLVRRVTITEPESRPKAPTRRRTFTELFKYG